MDIHNVLNTEESIEQIKLNDIPYAFGARFQLDTYQECVSHFFKKFA